ncbi:MAG: DegT/DnrJ/EryC1/StrS family aminotransferase, partial [Proteobacteria bacterium]|nr:DegT/DnrJ/EryC1/StrS family aminotransferase [Pseudomonadota bacterium]
MIPFFDLKSQYKSIATEVKDAIEATLESGWFVLGERLSAFEEEFASYTGARYGVGVGNGTDALTLALRAVGVGEGDFVVTVPNTAIPTVSAIKDAGASPLFVDIDEESFTMDPVLLGELLEAKAKEGVSVKAIIPVHLYGQCADMDKITELAEKFGAVVLEDACQAVGAEYKGKKAGSMGIAGAFSFYPSKNLGAYGDGGMVVTSDEEVFKRLKLLRNYGQSDRYHSVTDGTNSRLDDLQAAVLSVKLKYLDEWTKRRRKLAALYNSLLDPKVVRLPKEPKYSTGVYHLYVVRHPEREKLQKFLQENGVSTLIHYPIPIHL